MRVLSKLQTEYAPRGLQVLASAIEQDSQLHVRLFVKNFAPPFPVGYNTGPEADRLVHPTGKLPMMPLLAFIDKQGVVRAEHEGAIWATDEHRYERRLILSVFLCGPYVLPRPEAELIPIPRGQDV